MAVPVIVVRILCGNKTTLDAGGNPKGFASEPRAEGPTQNDNQYQAQEKIDPNAFAALAGHNSGFPFPGAPWVCRVRRHRYYPDRDEMLAGDACHALAARHFGFCAWPGVSVIRKRETKPQG